MKLLLLLFLFLFSYEIFGACTPLTRENYGAFKVLKSSELNTDFNNIVDKVNNIDGSCVQGGTLELKSFTASDLAILHGQIKNGCKLSYVDANTVSVSACTIGVGQNLVQKNTTTNIAFGCTGCAPEVGKKLYYVYAKASSVGGTLDLTISDEAPLESGYDTNGNRIIGRFYNGDDRGPLDTSGENETRIYPYSMVNYLTNKFDLNEGDTIAKSVAFSFSFKSDSGFECTGIDTICTVNQSGDYVKEVKVVTSEGQYAITFKRSYKKLTCSITMQKPFATPIFIQRISDINGDILKSDGFILAGSTTAGGSYVASIGYASCVGY